MSISQRAYPASTTASPTRAEPYGACNGSRAAWKSLYPGNEASKAWTLAPVCQSELGAFKQKISPAMSVPVFEPAHSHVMLNPPQLVRL